MRLTGTISDCSIKNPFSFRPMSAFSANQQGFVSVVSYGKTGAVNLIEQVSQFLLFSLW